MQRRAFLLGAAAMPLARPAIAAPNATLINEVRRKKAHDELWKWLKGDHASNNTYR